MVVDGRETPGDGGAAAGDQLGEIGRRSAAPLRHHSGSNARILPPAGLHSAAPDREGAPSVVIGSAGPGQSRIARHARETARGFAFGAEGCRTTGAADGA
jgi:hypothetical protein